MEEEGGEEAGADSNSDNGVSAKVAMLALCLRTIELAVCVKQEFGMIGPQAFQELSKAIDHGKDQIGLQKDHVIEAVWLKIKNAIETEGPMLNCLPPLHFRHLLVAAEMLYAFLSAVYCLSKHDYQIHWHLHDNVGSNKILSDESAMRKAFDDIDKDGNGTLDREELVLFARQVRPEKELGESDLLAAISTMDGDGNGEITFEEFQEWWRKGGMDEMQAEQEVQTEICKRSPAKPCTGVEVLVLSLPDCSSR